MAVQDIAVILDRLTVATTESPIIVFRNTFGLKNQKGETQYEAFFANTVKSKQMMFTHTNLLVGVFHRGNIDLFKDLVMGR